MQVKGVPMDVASLFTNMTVLVVISIVLSLLPILAAVLFRGFLVARKQNDLTDEIKKLNGEQSEMVEGRGGVDKVRQLIDNHYRWRALLLPSSLVSAFYLAGFVLGLDYIHTHDAHIASRLFPGNVLVQARLLLYTFLGVYLFNSGTLIRRVYLIDLSEQVFWAAIYRMLLSMGLAITLLPFGFTSHVEVVFFAIGFLANVFLDWVLEMAMQIGGINVSKREDFSLRMVRGINIWKDYRLEEEGIENAQNLATADAIELAVKTHYSLRTLIDWIDQAMVITRFGLKTKDLEAAGLNVSAIELAWLAPEATGSTAVAEAIAKAGKMDVELIKAQLNSLYEDAFVRELWTLWQTKPEFQQGTIRMPILVAPPHPPGDGKTPPPEAAGKTQS
jgi:hypothetical protein